MDCGELDEGEEILRQLFVSGSDPPAMLDAIEEPLNVIALSLEMRPEANRTNANASPFSGARSTPD